MAAVEKGEVSDIRVSKKTIRGTCNEIVQERCKVSGSGAIKKTYTAYTHEENAPSGRSGLLQLILGLLCVFQIAQTTIPSNSINLSDSLNYFSDNLYKHVREVTKPSKNIIISPLSIYLGLGLLSTGAQGQSLAEISNVLRLPSNELVADKFKSLLAPLKDSKQLKIANKVFVKSGYSIAPHFNDVATKQFASETQSLDFADNQNAANTINTWVEYKTNNHIKDLIDADSISDQSRMLLVNAIYFKDNWRLEFEYHSTKKAKFHTSETDTFEVDMMQMDEFIKFAEIDGLEAKVIQLFYVHSNASMLFILPNSPTGLADVQTKLQQTDLKSIRLKLSGQNVIVNLPKFKIEFDIKLPQVLTKMGLTSIFSDAADFSGLLKSNEPLTISDVVHKAVIDVNEVGTEAASATDSQIRWLSHRLGERATFNANHPFKFYLLDSDTVLLAGDFIKPEQ